MVESLFEKLYAQAMVTSSVMLDALPPWTSVLYDRPEQLQITRLVPLVTDMVKYGDEFVEEINAIGVRHGTLRKRRCPVCGAAKCGHVLVGVIKAKQLKPPQGGV